MKQIITVLALFLTLISINSQEYRGRIISLVEGKPVEFANIGIIGKNRGTVSDEKGNFTLNIQGVSEEDTIRISKIGYKPLIMNVEHFKNLSRDSICLTPIDFKLPEVTIVGSRKIIMYGEPVPSSNLVSVFGSLYGDFWLGQELGVVIDVRKKVLIRTININMGICSLDSVQLRLNIYKTDNKNNYHNILKQPIYFSFEKDAIKEPVVIDVTNDSILVNGKILVTIEVYKDLGKGKLGMFTKNNPFVQECFFRESSEAPWKTSPGKLGIYLYGEMVK